MPARPHARRMSAVLSAPYYVVHPELPNSMAEAPVFIMTSSECVVGMGRSSPLASLCLGFELCKEAL